MEGSREHLLNNPSFVKWPNGGPAIRLGHDDAVNIFNARNAIYLALRYCVMARCMLEEEAAGFVDLKPSKCCPPVEINGLMVALPPTVEEAQRIIAALIEAHQALQELGSRAINRKRRR
jgi:hypothetical protein